MYWYVDHIKVNKTMTYTSGCIFDMSKKVVKKVQSEENKPKTLLFFFTKCICTNKTINKHHFGWKIQRQKMPKIHYSCNTLYAVQKQTWQCRNTLLLDQKKRKKGMIRPFTLRQLEPCTLSKTFYSFALSLSLSRPRFLGYACYLLSESHISTCFFSGRPGNSWNIEIVLALAYKNQIISLSHEAASYLYMFNKLVSTCSSDSIRCGDKKKKSCILSWLLL